MSEFDFSSYLLSIPERALEIPEGRRELTRLDPLAFALVYLPHHLKSDATNNEITLSKFHLDLVEHCKQWVKPLGRMRQFRDAYVAPREIGKSTWLFLLLPMWAAAHGHLKFVAAFADSATQAQDHLATFRQELDANSLLQTDFSSLCTPARRTRVARQLADNRNQIQQGNGFVMMARGIDSAVLGMKVGAKRPDLIILDDVEPGESNYSLHQMQKRLRTIQDVVLPLNNFARVILSGTVTMAGSIIHQLVTSVTRPGEPTEPWIADENFVTHYYPAILTNDDGTEQSVWPEKWPLEELQSIRHTRSFRSNFMNDPVDADGQFWSPADIQIQVLDEPGPTLLSIDPAVTSKITSDFTGLSVISRTIEPVGGHHLAYVRHAEKVRLAPAALRSHVLVLLERFEEIGLVLIETNQGGDTWKEILHGLPVNIRTVHQSDSKPVRAQRALNFYQRSRVFHETDFPALTDELYGFPNVAHDDVLDSVVTGVNFILDAKKRAKTKSRARQMSYTS